MMWLFTAFLDVIAEIMKVAFIPAMIVMLVSIPAKPVINMLKLPEEPRQRLLRFFVYASYVSTALVLLGFVLLFGSLWMAGKQAHGG